MNVGLKKNMGHYKSECSIILMSEQFNIHIFSNVVIFCFENTGRISITLDSDWKEPATLIPRDVEAAERAMQFKLGWYAHPVFVNGDYPEVNVQ